MYVVALISIYIIYCISVH